MYLNAKSLQSAATETVFGGAASTPVKFRMPRKPHRKPLVLVSNEPEGEDEHGPAIAVVARWVTGETPSEL